MERTYRNHVQHLEDLNHVQHLKHVNHVQHQKHLNNVQQLNISTTCIWEGVLHMVHMVDTFW